MKQFNVDFGGHNLVGDDLLFTQSAIIEALGGFVQGFAGDFYVISGINLLNTAGVLTWDAGWIFMNGEIFQVDAGTCNYVTDHFFNVAETNDSTGDQYYEDTVLVHTYKIRKATIIGLTGNDIADLKYLKKYYDFHYPAAMGGAWNSQVQYGLTVTGEILMRGNSTVSSYANSTDNIIFTLPVGYRPLFLSTLLLPCVVGSTKTFAHVTVGVNGDVSPLGLTNGTTVTIYFDGFRLSR